MPWITPTTTDVETRLLMPEINAIKSIASKGNVPYPLPDIILNVVREIRGYIGACAKNKLGPADTIPEQLMGTALALIRFRLLNYLPTEVLETDPRRREYDTAIGLLKSVAKCDFAVEQPLTQGPEIMPTGSGATLVKRTHLQFTRHSTNQL